MELKIYKRGQGVNTRLWSGLVGAAIVSIGCFSLYEMLKPTNNIWLYTLAPSAVWAGLVLLVFWLVNKPNVADFLIAAEGEVKKVSWSSRRELVASTTIVIVLVLAMGFMLQLVDLFFIWLFSKGLGLY
ncbi:MAG: preprotein translocase subunit SecE [Phycisphaerae bacterium]|nr:preprotein translocase subunit SecE [Phycisphaerae bacterium]